VASEALLVDRELELSAVERGLVALREGSQLILGVVGEPGIGKSRLLDELADRATQRGALVLAGRASELERDLPFALLVEALDAPAAQHADVLEGLERDMLAELAGVLPGLRRAAGVAPGAGHGERHRTARAIRALLEQLARQRPLALVLDDVHWADPASADALALLLHRPPLAPVLVALATRTGRAPRLEAALAQAARDGAAEVLELGPLGADAVAALVPHVGRAARERLYEESGGNPFYLEELVRSLDRRGDGAAPGGLQGVPRAVRAALAAELGAVPDDVRVVLEGAAVAGDPFEPELAAAAAAVAEEVALAALDALIAADLVRPTIQPRRFRFRHPLVRRAVYQGAGGGWRLAAHARAERTLAARGASPAQRAHHAERAGRPGDLATVALLADAARETMAAAPATAAGWLEASLRLLPESDEHAARRLDLLSALGAALTSAGRAADAREVLRRLLRLLPADAAAERVAAAVALTDLAALWTDRMEGLPALLTAERAALGERHPDLTAALTLAMSRERAQHGDRAVAETLAEEARAGARAAGDPVLEADAAVAAADAAQCALRRDDPDALAAVDAKLAEAGTLVDALSDEQVAERLPMLLWLGVSRLSTGKLHPGLEVAERGLALARRSRQGLLAPAFVVLRGLVRGKLGPLDGAEADAEEALESALLSGNAQVASFASGLLSWVDSARGRVDAALHHAQAVWDHLPAVPYTRAGWTIAEARLAAGDVSGALAALDEFGWPNPAMWPLDRVRAIDVAVRVLLAVDRVEEAASWARRMPAEGGGRRTGVFAAINARANAEVLLARGDSLQAARVALIGAAEGDAAHTPLWAERCRTVAGVAFAASGDISRAQDELRQAAAALDARGAWGYRDAALLALRRLGDRPRVAVPASFADGPLATLTPREKEVAELVGEGLTNAQIALRLKLSERTVEKHVSSSLAKLGVSTRTAVVRLLARG
jgi:DNA-binding CsgD family transcriptional regulator